MRSASAPLLANSDAHHFRAAAPQCESRPPPVELAMTTLTQPLAEIGADGARAIAQADTPTTTTSTSSSAAPITEPTGWLSAFQFTKDDIMRAIEMAVMGVLGFVVLLLVVRPLVRRIEQSLGGALRFGRGAKLAEFPGDEGLANSATWL